MEVGSAYIRSRAIVGDAWRFPQGDGAVTKGTPGYWLRRAEKAAEVPHIRRGGWHAFRRA